MNLGLEGRVCVVTGGTRGIGAATARMLAQEGGDGAVRGAQRRRPRARRDRPGRRRAAARGVSRARPWALVNNAGTSRARALDDLTDADWQEQWELHVMAPMRLMRAVAPAMAEAGGGRIVNVSSSSGRRPSGRLDASYSVTKAAAAVAEPGVRGRVRARRGVLVNAVAPGAVEGELWQGEGGLADQIARAHRPDARRGARGHAVEPAARPDGHRRGDRRRDRLPLLRAGVERHRRHLGGRRRRGSDQLLTISS